MDITLQRILSLIPVEHGERREFARAIGYKDGTIINHWIDGTSKSYRSKLYEIAQHTGVSIEWLKGGDGADEEIKSKLEKLTAAELVDVLKIATDLLNKKIDRS